MELNILFEQNPFWRNRGALDQDQHIRAVTDSPIDIVHPLEETMKVNEDRIYILRGPRQVGKTTLLKKIAKSLIANRIEPKNILYFAFDIGGIKDDRAVLDLIKTYQSYIERKRRKRIWLLLDEVTYTSDWSTGLKAAYDLGLLKNATLIATGSSSLDLKRGTERLPGRRGIKSEENDIFMLPLSFRQFIKSYHPELSLPAYSSFEESKAFDVSMKLSAYAEQIKYAFDQYMLTGGYPLPMISLRKSDSIDHSVYHTHLQAILGDIAKAGKNEYYMREIITAIISKKSEPISWHSIARMTNVGSHNTIAEYVEYMEAIFILIILYQTANLGNDKTSYKKRRKLYYQDPFTFHTLNSWILGTQSPFERASQIKANREEKSKLIEAVCASHLMRLCAKVLFWRNNSEIDFVCYKERKPIANIEVKYQTTITSDDKKGLKKVNHGILLSRDSLHFDNKNNIAIIPVSYFLAGLQI